MQPATVITTVLMTIYPSFAKRESYKCPRTNKSIRLIVFNLNQFGLHCFQVDKMICLADGKAIANILCTLCKYKIMSPNLDKIHLEKLRMKSLNIYSLICILCQIMVMWISSKK